MKTKLALILVFLLTGISASLQQIARAQSKPSNETFSGTVIGFGAGGNTVNRGFTLTIEGYTSDAEARRFSRILKSKGQDGLLKALTKGKKGTFALVGELGRDVNAVRVHETPTGKLYTIVFERWLHFFELRYGTRSEDYPFTYIELHVDEKGIGGTLLPAAKIRFNKQNMVEIENFGIYPARLVDVKRES